VPYGLTQPRVFIGLEFKIYSAEILIKQSLNQLERLKKQITYLKSNFRYLTSNQLELEDPLESSKSTSINMDESAEKVSTNEMKVFLRVTFSGIMVSMLYIINYFINLQY
jgi:hypothetical protein